MPDSRINEARKFARSSKDLADEIIPGMEKTWGIIIGVDRKILEEAVVRAYVTLDHLGIENPNHFKQAGHLGFWVRKLKPLRVVDLKDFQETFCQLIEAEAINGTIEQTKSKRPPSRCRFINEFFSILIAIGTIKSVEGKSPDVQPEGMNDLVTNLRYHSFSPSAFAAILEARMP